MAEPSERQADARKRRLGAGWLGGLYRRVSVSMLLSAAAHAAAAGAAFLILLHADGGGAIFRPREISVSLLEASGSPSQGDRAGRSHADVGDDRPPRSPQAAGRTVADEAEDGLRREHRRRSRKTSEEIGKSAERVVRRESLEALRRVDAGFRRRQARLAEQIAALSEAGQSRSQAADAKLKALRAEMARLARERAWRVGRQVSLDGRGAGGGQRIFEAPPKGARRIVYVVDRSGSMQNKFHIVQEELRAAVEALTGDKFFHVVFYADAPLEMGARRLVAASAENKAKAAAFIDRIHAEGGTEPRQAVRRAVECGAELIYLLTDGEFEDTVVGFIDELNPGKRVGINTICFLDRRGEKVLKEIARRNNGSYTFVR